MNQWKLIKDSKTLENFWIIWIWGILWDFFFHPAPNPLFSHDFVSLRLICRICLTAPFRIWLNIFFWVSVPVPLAQSRLFPGQVAQCSVPASSAWLQEWKSFRQSLPPFDICHDKDFIFLVPNEDSSAVSCVHCWFFYHQAPVRRVWFHLFCTLPWGAAMSSQSLLFFELNKPNFQPHASSHFPAPHHLGVSPLDSHWHVNLSFTGQTTSGFTRYCSPLDFAIHRILFPKCQGEGNNDFPSPSEQALVHTGPRWLPPFTGRVHWYAAISSN